MTTSIFAPTTVTPLLDTEVTLADAQALIWREAELLDRLEYKPWLGLWTAEAYYVIPADRAGGEATEKLNIVYDDANMRAMRVKRLISGFAMASAPPARTVRMVSRFVVADSGPGVISLRAAQMLIEFKYGRTRTLAADVEFRLVATAEGLKIDRKVVTLINADEPLHGIGYLL